MSEQIDQKYNIVDLFAGAGGLSYGFFQTGRFSVKAAFEMNTNAQATYQRNHGNQVFMYGDVEDALSTETKERLGQIDVVIGGPPCQGFSNVNRQKNHAVSQNNALVKKFVQSVLNLNPKAFVMENVGMLQSDIHRFYVDKNDKEIIKKYNIATTLTEILLIDEAFLFDGVVNVIRNRARIARYLWNEDDYLVLNVIYKVRKNKEKLKAALTKHKKRLLALAICLTKNRNEGNHIIHYNNITGDALQHYFAENHTDEKAAGLCSMIEPAIMLQRMLSKAKEIHDNNIVVTKYIQGRGLAVQVKSMAVIDYIESVLGADDNGYILTKGVLPAATFGVPQKRMRFVVMGIKESANESIVLPTGSYAEANFRTVEDAIKDIESVETVNKTDEDDSGIKLPEAPEIISDLGRQLRDADVLCNHFSTNTTHEALERFKAIQQGGNFHSLPQELKTSYSDTERTQNTIYLRLRYDEPSGTVVNVRKSMWIHPIHHRALSIREAARLQTFPDSFVFCGPRDSQYQQIGNAVPPILAKALAEHLCGYLDNKSRNGEKESVAEYYQN